MSQADQPVHQDAPTSAVAAVEFAPDDAPTNATSNGQVHGDAVKLLGYVGESEIKGSVRLYGDITMLEWLDIPEAAIVARVSEAGESKPAKGKSVLFVTPSAMLVVSASVRASAPRNSATSAVAKGKWPPASWWG